MTRQMIVPPKKSWFESLRLSNHEGLLDISHWSLSYITVRHGEQSNLLTFTNSSGYQRWHSLRGITSVSHWSRFQNPGVVFCLHRNTGRPSEGLPPASVSGFYFWQMQWIHPTTRGSSSHWCHRVSFLLWLKTSPNQGEMSLKQQMWTRTDCSGWWLRVW